MHFFQITSVMTYTNRKPSQFEDYFQKIKQMLDEFNKDYDETIQDNSYISSWLN